MAIIPLAPGTIYRHDGQLVKLSRVLNLEEVLVELPTGQCVRAAIADLYPAEITAKPERDVYQFESEAAREVAIKRFAIIEPLLSIRIPLSVLTATIQRHGVSESTLRRWIRAYQQQGLPGLLRQKSKAKDQSRLPARIDQIIYECIDRYYNTEQGLSVAYTHEKIQLRCAQEQLPAPSLPTLHRRIRKLNRQLKIQRRLGRQVAREQLDHTQKSTLQANYPLHVVELDHSLLNILLVDEDTNRPLRRPWLTLALDVYSRMVVGFYLDFETPGSCGTGLCLTHALLPKETWLAEHNIDGAWPCKGKMDVLYTDNAKEFRGSVLARACEQYGIEPRFRPPRRPNYGGHIERFFRTLKWRIRHLPGAYHFSKKKNGTYRPSQRAIFTRTDFERWLGMYIVCLYHQRRHSELHQSPFEYFTKGILEDRDRPGCPVLDRLANELQVRLDFMPFVERTVQRYGVRIGHLTYYDPVLSAYIYGAGETPIVAAMRKYVFRYDPRNMTCVYFLDPSTREYHKIPLSDMASGDFSIQTLREAMRRLQDRMVVGERLSENALLKEIQAIHDCELKVQEREMNKKASTKSMTLSQRRHRQEVKSRTGTTVPSSEMEEVAVSETDNTVLNTGHTIQPFEILDDGTSELFYC